MTETPETPTNATGGGQTPDPGDGSRTFTQADIDRIVAERLSRQADKYADYADLKQAAGRLAEIEEAQKSELQKAQEAREAAERTAQAALTSANERLTRAAFIAAAAQAGAAHPEDAYALAAKAGVQVTEDGNVAGVTEAVQALVEAGRLVMSGRQPAPNLNAGAGGGNRPAEKLVSLTPEEEQTAQAMGISLEDYAKFKTKK